MTSLQPDLMPVENLLLGALPQEEWGAFISHLEPVDLPNDQILYHAQQSLSHVYFPYSGVISLLSVTREGGTIEVGMIGNRGVLGVQVILGVDTTPHQVLVQVPGTAVRIKSARLIEAVDQHPVLRKLLLRYSYALFLQITQSAVCNRFHSVEERIARWLLDTQDRTASSTLPYTQELLSNILGVNRVSVTLAAGGLQKLGLISYSRGQIRIVDRAGLKVTSCECYAIIRQEYDHLLTATSR